MEGPRTTAALGTSPPPGPSWTHFKLPTSSPASSSAEQDAATSSVLQAALEAHGQGQPVLVDLQGGSLNFYEHSQSWKLIVDLLAREDGPEVTVCNGQLYSLPCLIVEGACYMSNLAIRTFSMPQAQVEGKNNLLFVTGALTLSGCMLSLPIPETPSSSSNSHTSSTSNKKANRGSKNSTGDVVAQIRHCALRVAGSSARLRAHGCRFSGFQHALMMGDGAQAEVEGCEASLTIGLGGDGEDACIEVRRLEPAALPLVRQPQLAHEGPA